jgi:hypothetical protein
MSLRSAKETYMRIAAITAAGALGLAASAIAANAAPAVPGPADQQNIIQIAGGCGWGFHPNRWGRCVPNRYGYRAPSWRGYYGGGYYRWHSPSDRVANQLNRQELGRLGGWGY